MEQQMNEQQEHNAPQPPAAAPQKRPRRVLTAALITLIVLLIGVVAFLALRLVQQEQKPDSRYELSSEAVEGLIPGRSAEEIQEILDKTVEEGMFNVSINGQITVGADKKGDVCIENISANHYNMQVDIIVTDSEGTQVTVYSSGILKPGFSIENGTFAILPPDGTVDAVAVFRALDPDTMTEIGRTNVNVILTRES